MGVEYLFLNFEALEVSFVELDSFFAVLACCSLDVVLGSEILEISLLELDSFLVVKVYPFIFLVTRVLMSSVLNLDSCVGCVYLLNDGVCLLKIGLDLL